MVVVFIVAKSRTCFVEYNSHDSFHARLTEGIGVCTLIHMIANTK